MKTKYIRNIHSLGGKKVFYELSYDQNNWSDIVEENIDLLKVADTEGILIIESQTKGEMWKRHMRSMKEECIKKGTTDFRVNVEKHSFFLKGDAYYVGPSLQGLNADELAKEGRNIEICDASIDKGKSWVSCLYKVVDRSVIQPPVMVEDNDLEVNCFNYDESLKKHALSTMILKPEMEFWYFPSDDKVVPLWIYNNKEVYMMKEEYAFAVSSFVWIIEKTKNKEDFCWLLDFIDKHYKDLWIRSIRKPEELLNEMKVNIRNIKIANSPQNIKTVIEWAWIDLQSLLKFFNYCTNFISHKNKPTRIVGNLRECTTLEELAMLILSESTSRPDGMNPAKIDKDDDELPF